MYDPTDVDSAKRVALELQQAFILNNFNKILEVYANDRVAKYVENAAKDKDNPKPPRKDEPPVISNPDKDKYKQKVDAYFDQ